MTETTKPQSTASDEYQRRSFERFEGTAEYRIMLRVYRAPSNPPVINPAISDAELSELKARNLKLMNNP